MNWHVRLTRKRRAFVIHRRNGGEMTYRLFCATWQYTRPTGDGERLAA